MRIAILIDWHLYYTAELANALSSGHQVMLITRDHSHEISPAGGRISIDDFLDETLDKAVLRDKLRYRCGNPRSFFEVTRIYKKIKDFKPDIVHIQETGDWRIFLLAKMVGFSKVVLTVHDVSSHPGEGRVYQNYVAGLMRSKASRTIVHGEYLKKKLIEKMEYRKLAVSVVPHGVFAIFTKWDKHDVHEDENSILFFGRISKYKGLDVLIKAQPLITEKIKNSKIIIAGTGADFSEYEALIKDNPCFEVHNRFIPYDEVYRFFCRSSVVVLSYIEASQSGVAAIAYAFGKPIVATNVGSVPEVVEEGKTGFIVPPGDPEMLAQAIIKILQDKELRERMRKNMFDIAHGRLSWENVAKLTAQVYAGK